MGVRTFGRLIRAGLLIWLATYALVLAAQYLVPWSRTVAGPADAIVCLGAGISFRDEDTSVALPDDASLRRAEACAAAQIAGQAPVVVFTGAGEIGFPAAAAMAHAAEAAGLPTDAVLVEPEAQSTIQNAAFSLALLPPNTDHVVVVSDGFHLPRAWVIFTALGIDDVDLMAAAPVPADSDGYAAVTNPLWRWALRETVAIWFNAGRAAAYWAAGLTGIDADTRIGWFD